MAPSFAPTSVVVHPLVLLSVVDHFKRVTKGADKRVVGLLLGSWSGKKLDVSNSFARASCRQIARCEHAFM
jgi:26S proteasome regulatory subunit N8